MADYAYLILNCVLNLIVWAFDTDDHRPPNTRRERFWLWCCRFIFLAIVAAVIFAIWWRF
jgi:hypothetical protein